MHGACVARQVLSCQHAETIDDDFDRMSSVVFFFGFVCVFWGGGGVGFGWVGLLPRGGLGAGGVGSGSAR